MDTNSGLRGFDDYRLQRKRMQAKLGLQQNSLGYENNALKELEQVEAREVREQQLSREVHDFFAAATKQAAAIVEKVARDAESAIGSRIQEEMESFLRDALERVNGMVGALLVKQQRNPKLAQADVEPKIGNLDSQILDEFRWEGTAEGADKHIGQDPFATDLDDVRKEFRDQIGGMEGEGLAPAPMDIEEHLVAATEDQDDDGAAPEQEPEHRAAQAEHDAPADYDPTPTPEQELDRFKSALKALVRQGTMTRDEARAAWQTRLASLGLK
ncbi:MAG: hypothetical protein H6838_17120 [Planctomycetes bacterium]|nr:hypothetical protein [Planctomycetota bacterium]MCB9887215.1 hypothetical protein [Planctomycetota bacterium]